MKRSRSPRYSDQSDYEDDKTAPSSSSPPPDENEAAPSSSEEDEAAPSSSSPPPVREDGFQYDVFLSFRGPDTRKGFTSHLYEALQDRGIHTFIDSKKLKKGQKVNELFGYIERSKIFVPIFSKGYANSEWCLKEITKMVECKRLIIPVFFDVEPRDVRGQSGPFEPAFTRYGKNDITNKEDVKKWRNALTEAGDVSGYNLANTDGYEARLIKLIVKRILTEVNKTPLFVAKHRVGLDSRVAELVEMLKVEAQNDVKMVGIHGMGGIGKTTLARAVYSQIYPHFDASCFISDVREAGKQSKLFSLQEQLLRDVFRDEEVKVNDTAHGTGMIKWRIKSKKVLLVLDDVDSKPQLDALAGSVDWFRSGSRIIITTRDKQVLIGPLRMETVYELKVLDDIQSLQLFCWHAFGKEEPKAEIAELSKKVADTAAGLPLALEIFGSHFFCLETNKEREDMLKKLKKNQHEGIHERLKISFDALGEEEKTVFLDIACFFIGKNRDFATLKWQDISPDLTIKFLMHKSLININEDTRQFEMHDHIRDMGRKIVEDESRSDPGMRSRLWKKDDLLYVLQNKRGTEKIEAIDISCLSKDYVDVDAQSFAGMSQLRMLRLENVALRGEYGHFPRTLKWLNWNPGYLDSLPNTLPLENIVVLDLSKSSITQLWNHHRFRETKVNKNTKDLGGFPSKLSLWNIVVLDLLRSYIDQVWCHKRSGSTKVFSQLKVLNLSGCRSLTICPDFTGMPHLEELYFRYCEALTELHPSIWRLTSLQVLDLSRCYQITALPSQPRDSKPLLSRLKVLNLSFCWKFAICPDFSCMPYIEELDFQYCQKMTELHPSIWNLKRLTRLSLRYCRSLEEGFEEVWKLASLKKLDLTSCERITLPSRDSSSLNQLLGKLKILHLCYCRNLTSCPNFTGMPHLEKLDFKGCWKLKELDPSIGHLKRLTHLSLEGCRSLKELPVEVWQLTSLEELDLSMCYGIAALPSQLKRSMLGKLKIMKLCSCMNLTCPEFTRMPHLERLDFNACRNMTELHPSIGRLEGLTRLNLRGCGSLKELPKEAWQLTSLENLDLSYCCKIATLPSELGNSERLKELFLDGTIITALPESMRHLKQLKRLSLNGCRFLKEIPEGIHSCISLEALEATDCVSLASFPNVLGDLRSLQSLCLSGTAIEELPSSIHSLTEFQELSIIGCKRLKFLPQLPRSIHRVYAADCCEMEETADVSKAIVLREMDLTGCQKLVDVPGVEQLRCLEKLKVEGCRSLSDSFKKRVQEADFPNLEELTIPGSMEESSDARSHSSSGHLAAWVGLDPLHGEDPNPSEEENFTEVDDLSGEIFGGGGCCPTCLR